MKVVVMGSRGFLGRALVASLLDRRHEVLEIYRAHHAREFDRSRVGLHSAVGSLEAPPVEAIRAFAPDAAISLAWDTTPTSYLEAWSNHVYVASTLEFLRLCSDLGCSTISALSSCYATLGRPVQSGTVGGDIALRSAYALAKRHLESGVISLASSAKKGCRSVVPRVYFPYGPGEHPSRLVSFCLREIQAGRTPELRSAHSIVDYVHTSDCAQAITYLLESELCGVVEIGSGIPTRVIDVALTCAEICGQTRTAEALRDIERGLPGANYMLVADLDLIASTGWRTKTTLRLGVQSMLR